MIEEIIYTSAQKGLKAGSRGFCTVVSTAGMALNTAERLESMSGYRHAFPMQDPRAQQNPVNYSHVTLRIGGKNAHVISRVSDAGQDYSGRTNKLAHHLMFDDVSRFVAGPARLMVENGVLVTQWDGNVRNVPPRDLPVPALPKSVELKAWKAATGDSGWAGWVAEQLMKDKAPVSVIFSAGTDTLTLVREALDLLPPTQRWSITYCTYFTKLLAGTECQLRFVLDDTPEATALRNDARARVVDLTKGLGAAQGGPIVEQARTGRVLFGNSDIPELRISNRSQPQVQADPIRQVLPAPGRIEESLGSGSLPEIPTLNSRAPAIPVGSRSGPPDLFDEPIRKSRRWTWMLYAVGSLMLMGVASGVIYFVVFKTDRGPRGPAETPSVASNNAPIAKGDPRFEISTSPNSTESSGKQGDVAEVQESIPPGANAPAESVPPINAQPVEPERSDPFSLARKSQNTSDTLVFETPEPGSTNSTSFPLIVRSTDSIQVECVKSFLTQVKNTNQISIEYLKTSETQWNVRVGQEGSDKELWKCVGTVSLKKIEETGGAEAKGSHELDFSWVHGIPVDADIAFVRWCPLRISADGVTVGVLLRRPVVTDPIETREFLGNPQNKTYTFKTNPQDFPEMSAEKIEGLNMAVTMELPEEGQRRLTFILRDASPVKVVLVADPPLTECKNVDDVPKDNKLVTEFTFQIEYLPGMDTTITVTQQALLRALGMTDAEKGKLLKYTPPKGVSEITLPNTKFEGLAQVFRPLVELQDFNTWHIFSPFRKNALQKKAEGICQALEKFSNKMQDSKSSIPVAKADEKPDSQDKIARVKFDKILSEVKPLVETLKIEASEEAVTEYETEVVKTRKWIEECNITATVSATFEVEGGKPITVTFLETAIPKKGAAE